MSNPSAPITDGKTDYSKLVAGTSAGGGAAMFGIVAVWFVDQHLATPMPPEIAAAAVGFLTWMINNIGVFLKTEKL